MPLKAFSAIILSTCFALVVISCANAETPTVPAPGPSSSKSNCTLPDGRVVFVPKGSNEQGIYSFVSTISVSYTSVVARAIQFLTGSDGLLQAGGIFASLSGRRLLQAGAPRPASVPASTPRRAPGPAPGPSQAGLGGYPPCCQSKITLSGDTASSLAGDSQLVALFYAINPKVMPVNQPDSPITPGINVTLPCSRIVSLGLPP